MSSLKRQVLLISATDIESFDFLEFEDIMDKLKIKYINFVATEKDLDYNIYHLRESRFMLENCLWLLQKEILGLYFHFFDYFDYEYINLFDLKIINEIYNHVISKTYNFYEI